MTSENTETTFLSEDEPNTPGADVVLRNLLQLLQQSRQETHPSSLKAICLGFINFMQELPPPPAEWKERVGSKADKFEYHQLVLPEALCDPELDDLANIKDIMQTYSEKSFQALEYSLLTRNYFLFTDGHMDSIYCPKPLIMLEHLPIEGAAEEDWDCFFYLFPDGSFVSFALDEDEDENIGLNGEAIFLEYREKIARLRLRFPVEGQDYGHLDSPWES
jgi:hypothetical protein